MGLLRTLDTYNVFEGHVGNVIVDAPLNVHVMTVKLTRTRPKGFVSAV
jgi:hypothetical protein